MSVKVHVRLYGAFRKYVTDELVLELPPGTSVDRLRRSVAEALRARAGGFADEALLEASVLADERHVLDDADVLVGESVSLAILPPVCGG